MTVKPTDLYPLTQDFFGCLPHIGKITFVRRRNLPHIRHFKTANATHQSFLAGRGQPLERFVAFHDEAVDFCICPVRATTRPGPRRRACWSSTATACDGRSPLRPRRRIGPVRRSARRTRQKHPIQFRQAPPHTWHTVRADGPHTRHPIPPTRLLLSTMYGIPVVM